MPLKINPKDLKIPAKLTAQIKDISPAAGKKNPWNQVHRLKSTDGQLMLCTTNKSNWLEWHIPQFNSEAEDIDLYVPATQFNAMAEKSSEGAYYEITPSARFLIFNQSQRDLRLELREFGTYPPPSGPNGDAQDWTIETAPLAEALEFVLPFINVRNKKPGCSIVTWKTDGSMITGEPRQVAIATGLHAPRATMNFTQEAAKALRAFLTRVGDQVAVSVSGTSYSFTCTENDHRLWLQGGLTDFQFTPGRHADPDAETYFIDRLTILSSLDVLLSVMPDNANRIEFLVKGRGDVASILMSTPGSGEGTSRAEFAILRNFVGPDTGENGQLSAPETRFWINGEQFQSALSRLKPVTIKATFLPKRKLILIEESDSDSGEGLVRSLVLTVQRPRESGLSQAIEATDSGDHPPEAQPTPTKPTTDGGTSGTPESNGAKPSTSKK